VAWPTGIAGLVQAGPQGLYAKMPHECTGICVHMTQSVVQDRSNCSIDKNEWQNCLPSANVQLWDH
jgi:hypothetical protein